MDNTNSVKMVKYISALILLLVIVGIGFIVSSINKQKDTQQPTAQQSIVSSKIIDQYAAEQYCQDSQLLSKYVDIDNVSIVTADYRPLFMDSGYTTNDGSTVYLLQWNGEDKQSGSKVLFSCQISGNADAVTLNNLSINGKAAYGPNDIKGL